MMPFTASQSHRGVDPHVHAVAITIALRFDSLYVLESTFTTPYVHDIHLPDDCLLFAIECNDFCWHNMPVRPGDEGTEIKSALGSGTIFTRNWGSP